MEGSEFDEDEQYPAAPAPPHERAWRHPSEIGQDVWVRSEPPLTIGRGLLATTGAIGGLLAIAVLWAMLPGGGGGGVTALSTVTIRLTSDDIDVSSLAATTVATSPATTATTPATPSTAPATTPSTPRTTPSTPPTLVAPVATMTLQKHDDPRPAVVAVAVGAKSLIVTTASAVNENDTVTLSMPSGEQVEATVLMVDKASGLAVLSTESAPVDGSFPVAATAQTGDVITVLGDTPATVTITIADDGTMSLDQWTKGDIAEGTPVVNGERELVGLCSRNDAGPIVVPIGDLEGLQARADAKSQHPDPAAKPWLGVSLNKDPAGALTVNFVDGNGPSSAAGIVAGDTIVAVDTTPVVNITELATALSAHLPGDVLTITVKHGDGTLADVKVTLAERPDSM